MGQMVKKLMSSTKIAPWALVVGVAVGTFGAVQARADSTDELLELLRKKGAITKKEYAVIKTRHAAEKSSGAGGPYIRGDAGPAPRYITALDKGIGIRIPIPGIGIGPTKGEAPVGSEIDVTVSGSLSAFYVQQVGHTTKGKGTKIGGTLVDNNKNTAAVRGGALPANVTLDIATRQEGYDISGTLGIFSGINNTNTAFLSVGTAGVGNPRAFGGPTAEVLLAYMKVGTNSFGTFEAGRDFGLFGQDILTFDQNNLGVGVPGSGDGGNAIAGRASLGQVGFGYIFSDFIPQFRYTTEKFNGFDMSVAVETPLDASGRGAVGSTVGGGTSGAGTLLAIPGGLAPNSTGASGNQPMLAARLKYVGNLLPNAMLTAWAGGMTAELTGLRSATNTLLAGGKARTRAYAAEAGAKLDVGPAELIGYGYYGKGMGATGLFLDGLDNKGDGRDSYGFLAQASYTFFDRLTFAGGVGVSYLKHTAFDVTAGQLSGGYGKAFATPANPLANFATINNVKVNEAAIGTVRYKVTKWLNIVGQYAHAHSKSIGGTKFDSDAAIGGAQIFF